jgi:prepilin-type processing-associated H-X9-DG protein
LWGRKLGDIADTAKTILLMDSAPRHDERRVIAFCDGHVETRGEDRLPDLPGE